MQKLFTQICERVPTMHGWCTPEKACVLAGAIISLRPAVVVEIGVFGGRSFVPMAMALKAINHGVAYAIDPWSKDASIVGMEGANLEWWSRCDHDAVFASFERHLMESGARDISVIMRQKSRDVYLGLFPSIDFAHIDGNHGEEESCYDVEMYASRVRCGGLCFVDDVQWASKATQAMSKHGFEKLYALDTGAMFQRTSIPEPLADI